MVPVVAAAAVTAVCCALYYFMGITAEYVAIHCGVISAGGLISLLVSANYDSLLLYLVSVLGLGAAGYGLVFRLIFRWFPSDSELPWLARACLAVIAALGVVVRMLSGDGRFENFKRFFLVTNLILGALYAWGLVWVLLLHNREYSPFTGSMQWIPFARLSEYIEDVIMGIGEMQDVIGYLAVRILLYVPYGYYCAVLLKDNLVLVRFPLIVLLPIAVEGVQRIGSLGGTDIDDVIFGIIGGMLGVLVYCVIDGLRRVITGKGLLERESSY